MPLTLNELYTQTKQQYHFSMIAGEAGIDHIMNWVYVSEDSSTHDFEGTEKHTIFILTLIKKKKSIRVFMILVDFLLDKI